MPDDIDAVDEPEDAGDHEVPADLLELHEVLEYTGALGDGGATGEVIDPG